MRDYDHRRIERKWQRVWAEQKLYEAKDRPPRPDSQTNRGHPSLEKEGRGFPRSSASGLHRSALTKFYALIEFPYPSGDGLHVGHPRPYIGMDIIARKRRMEGYNVLYPIGWDAFGLPTENYALKTGIHPSVVTKRNAKNFKRQIQELGISFDWSRELNTTDPKYYRWTQWLFLQFFKHGLAYKKKMPINWCLSCKIGLANEEVVDGKCERCGGETEKREKEQWMLAITKYADRLDKDLDMVDYPQRIKTQQRNWIGKSEGAEIEFPISNFQFPKRKDGYKVKVFTTRADTLFGATYLVLAPEHPFVQFLLSSLRKQGTSRDSLDSRFRGNDKEERGNDTLIENREEVENYISEAKKKTEIERTKEGKEKTGVELRGIKAINPANGEKIPVWIADYVLAEYGTGAIMAVPAHDERDFVFAQKYQLPINEVIKPPPSTISPPAPLLGQELPPPRLADSPPLLGQELPPPRLADSPPLLGQEGRRKEGAFTGEGVLINSGKFNGLASQEAKKAITESIGGKMLTNYKLRDWVFSRQRYWGEPIPLIFCMECKKRVEGSKNYELGIKENHNSEFRHHTSQFSKGELLNPGWVAVPDDKLPVKLPNVQNYKPTANGESPLAALASWVNVKCPKCGGSARRETDTMPNWAGSSWYYLAYAMHSRLFPKSKVPPAPMLRRAGNGQWSKVKLEAWLPVDWYNGGMEHTTLHLLYSRFWHKFLYDIGLVPTPEPYAKRTSHGLILAEGGEKMSKSKGNVINPDEAVARFGADTFRVYEMFMGPFEQAIRWSTDSLVGARRFLERVWRLREKTQSTVHKVQTKHKTQNTKIQTLLHQTIKKVSEDIEAMRFNTAVSALMILANAMEKEETITKGDFEIALKLLSPFAPHLAEELWLRLGHKKSIHCESWPAYDARLAAGTEITIVVQVNGKTRGSFETERGLSQEEIQRQATAFPAVEKWIAGKRIKKVIVVPDRLVNIVV